MAQRIISNTFTLTAYIGGETYISTIVVDNGKLHQFYDKDGNGGQGQCSPDWETSINDQPKFHIECRNTGGELQNIEINENLKLYYNETVIPFDAQTKLSTGTFEGMFKYEDNGGVRYYTICKNVATAGNTDNDTLRIEGQIKTVGNNIENISSPIATIHVIPVTSGGSAYYMEINAPAIAKDKESTTITAMVYSSDGTGEITSGISYKWERLDGTQYVQVGTTKSLKVNRADVTGFEHYRCVATIGNVTVIGACSVFDYNDGIYTEFVMTGVGNPSCMRKSETAEITAKIVDGSGVELPPGKYGNKTITFTLIKKDGTTGNVIQANPITITYNDLVNTYLNSVTGHITLE